MAVSFPEYNYKQQLQTKQHQINLLRNHWLQPRKDSWDIPSQDADLKHCHGVGLVAKSCPTLATPWTVAYQAALSMGFPKQEYWSGLPCPPPGDLPNPGIEPGSPALQAGSLATEPPGKPEASPWRSPKPRRHWSWFHRQQVHSFLHECSGTLMCLLHACFMPGAVWSPRE